MGQGHGQGLRRFYYFTFFQEGYIALNNPLKDKTNLCFCNMCRFWDHSLEDFPEIIEEFFNKRTLNLIQNVPREDIFNLKSIHVFMRLGTRRGNSSHNEQVILPTKNHD